MLDGLVQGAGIDRAQLDAWVEQCSRHAVGFSIESEGDRFSLLADDATRKITDAGDDLKEVITSALESLAMSGNSSTVVLFSTLRSREYKPGREIQTLYVVEPGGGVSAQTREINADVQAPPTPLRGRPIFNALAALGALAVVVGISSFFINWSEVLLRAKVMAAPNQGVEFDASRLEPFITFKLTAIKQLDGVLEFELSRGTQWADVRPVSMDDTVPMNSPDMTWRKFLATAALKRGIVHCCLYNDKGELTGDMPLSVEALAAVEKITLKIALPGSRSVLKRVVITP